jgi:CubicO group peptidase (beta-lactamase class C family)
MKKRKQGKPMMGKMIFLGVAMVWVGAVVESAGGRCLAASPSEVSQNIVHAIQPFVDQQELAGAVMLVADKNTVIAEEAVGWMDVAAKKPMQKNSMFWIASQSKPIAAAALMTLVDEGKIKLDDPVEKYLPEFAGQMLVVEKDAEHALLRKPNRPITIRDILSHTSGLPFKSALEEPTLDLYPLAARVRSYAMTPLDFEPGSKYNYSNAGINTAARILEVVTGMPFEDYLSQRFFQPLGMKDTTFWPNEEQAARIAKAYKPAPDKKGLVETPICQLHYPLTDRTVRFPMPAGGLYSTAHDVMRFYQMLLNGGELEGRRYLSNAAVHELTSRQTPKDWKDSYGLGLNVTDGSFGHGGAYGSNTTAYPERDRILIWLIQHEAFPGDGQKAQGVFTQTVLDKP